MTTATVNLKSKGACHFPTVGWSIFDIAALIGARRKHLQLHPFPPSVSQRVHAPPPFVAVMPITESSSWKAVHPSPTTVLHTFPHLALMITHTLCAHSSTWFGSHPDPGRSSRKSAASYAPALPIASTWIRQQNCGQVETWLDRFF